MRLMQIYINGKNLKQRQEEHLRNLENMAKKTSREFNRGMGCLHDSCQECIGTGINKRGEMCVHAISCQCNKCSPTYL